MRMTDKEMVACYYMDNIIWLIVVEKQKRREQNERES